MRGEVGEKRKPRLVWGYRPGSILVLGWAALRACQDAGKTAYERNVTKGELGRNTAKILEVICGVGDVWTDSQLKANVKRFNTEDTELKAESTEKASTFPEAMEAQ